ncbi:MAG: 3-phosphoshikimate 1-carboxyvinyltransferase [Acutalibacter sp.]|jgi:3-phosphoshikimate 1-carboxyvinyltransferase|nr:3-phosphoshikimate 1-carboxyvinyltransferase [Acutalibacter sp.]
MSNTESAPQQVIYASTFRGGQVTVPPSKSAAIRAVLCASLARGGTLRHVQPSQDVSAALDAAPALGAQADFDVQAQTVTFTQAGPPQGGTVDCGESGSLLRFIIPIAAALGGRWRFVGRGRLPQRPIGLYGDLLPAHGVAFRTEGGLPLEIEGQLCPGRFELPGNISSQFVTGLMLALPLLPGGSEITLTSPLESRGYVDMTLEILKDYRISITPTEHGWHVPGGQAYVPRDRAVEGDWSQAAFFLNLAALSPQGAKVALAGLRPDSLQGDKACVEVFRGFGLDIRWEDGLLLAQNLHAAEPFGGLRGQTLDVSQITDMVPAASVCAALSQGETRFTNAARLRLKESDRLAAMAQAITALGGRAYDEGDTLRVVGVQRLAGGLAQGRNDHRILMSLAGAGLRSESPVRVTEPWSIRKTYPNFYDELRNLGGGADVVQLG